MSDGDPIVRAMAAVMLVVEMPLLQWFQICFVDAAKEYSSLKLCIKAELKGHGLWRLSSEGTIDAKAKQLMMQHLSDGVFLRGGLADGGCALGRSLSAAFQE